MDRKFVQIVEGIYENDQRYKEASYVFTMEALSFTQKKYKCSNHVSSDQMLDGIKELLLDKFGPMTMTVLEYWGIKRTEDFGNIIFNLVDNKVLSKTEEDDIGKFRDGYDFEEVFRRDYRKKLNRRVSKMRSV